ncbi:MAG: iron-containing alcohol dehydrogenase, partial [Gottschalkiaceae bacterium]
LEVIEGKLKPFIAVPSTSGTGSEATLVAVIANPEKKVKMEFISYNILPDVAVLDSRMTLSLPAKMTASTGMDALVHAIEGYTSIQKNPLSDAYAFASIDLIREYLIKTVKDGQSEENRLAMANASFMAGVAFSNSMVGIVHAIGHACGGVSHVPHGDAMTILLPHGMEYNLHKVEESYEKLLLPLGGAELYASTPKEKRAEKAIEVVKNMIKELNNLCSLPIRLRDVGILEKDFERIAKTALNDGAALANPIEVSYEGIMNILKNAY